MGSTWRGDRSPPVRVKGSGNGSATIVAALRLYGRENNAQIRKLTQTTDVDGVPIRLFAGQWWNEKGFCCG
jgi:hypothetical protein